MPHRIDKTARISTASSVTRLLTFPITPGLMAHFLLSHADLSIRHLVIICLNYGVTNASVLADSNLFAQSEFKH